MRSRRLRAEDSRGRGAAAPLLFDVSEHVVLGGVSTAMGLSRLGGIVRICVRWVVPSEAARAEVATANERTAIE
ncbi:MAG: hypothetical protein ACREJ3_00540 [Polyangiaceae bacterium]